MSSLDVTRDFSAAAQWLQHSAHQRRLRLVEAAVELLDTPGSPSLSLEVLSRATSAPPGMVHHYFDSLGALLCDVVYTVMDDLGEHALPFLDLPIDQSAPAVVDVFYRWSLLHSTVIDNMLLASRGHAELRGAFSEVHRQILRLLLNQLRFQDIESTPEPVLEVATGWLDTVTQRLLDVAAGTSSVDPATSSVAPADDRLATLVAGLDEVVSVAESYRN